MTLPKTLTPTFVESPSPPPRGGPRNRSRAHTKMPSATVATAFTGARPFSELNSVRVLPRRSSALQLHSGRMLLRAAKAQSAEPVRRRAYPEEHASTPTGRIPDTRTSEAEPRSPVLGRTPFELTHCLPQHERNPIGSDSSAFTTKPFGDEANRCKDRISQLRAGTHPLPIRIRPQTIALILATRGVGTHRCNSGRRIPVWTAE